MSITIIIPTLKIDADLERLLDVLPDDVIIVNGGHETYSFKDRNVINTNPGRGLQLASGARFAKGDWLFFLHADSQLKRGWMQEMADHMENHPDKAFAFRLRFDDDGFFPRLLEYWVRFRCWAFAMPYGDQGLFISRELYDEIGGYNDMPLMEDVDIIKRIGRSRLRVSDHEIITSAEKYNKYGYIIRMFRNGFCLALYKLGVDPATIKKIY
ncbi:glycosyltransferase [Pseudemcibacter aquimaris]|uniref:glycosyltransferase n=1 Tax=Pseudemcibacter aquimaris TaxID=2857064 RepID=UPI00201263BB|nr:glycosyltransferase [Pseudemcibacter aquimaris]MCC3860019.1 glycosyltransferase [Pseudemcibacter aquimaris]WDU57349.1 glycosyltransferase [Pseudemcibacter aquimaris]